MADTHADLSYPTVLFHAELITCCIMRFIVQGICLGGFRALRYVLTMPWSDNEGNMLGNDVIGVK